MIKTEAIEELMWIRDQYVQTDEEYVALTIAIRELVKEGEQDE